MRKGINNKFIKAKPNKFIVLLKGNTTQEKESILLNRCSFLKNNYCLYKTDKILIIEREDEVQNLKIKYEKINEHNLYDSLLTLNNDCVDIKCFKDIIKNSAIKENTFLEYGVQYNIIKTILRDIKNSFKRMKTLDREIQFFIDEIFFIKSNELDLNEYMCVTRKGRNIRKNSSSRKAVYLLYEHYNKVLQEKNYFDYEDYLKHIEDNICFKYSHIIIQHGEDFSLQEIKLINKMVNRDVPYSSFIISIKKDFNLRLKSVINEKYKTVNLKYKEELQSEKILKPNSIEKFNYVDFRHKTQYKFQKDYLNNEELFLDNNGSIQAIKSNELKDIVVYNDIAAGEPILMLDENEGLFKLPNYLFKGINKCFMLKVKGDSMVGADINDGDYVIIRQQFSANSGEIVAAEIDGSATLKRFSIKKKTPYLIAENPKYNPINLMEREGSILGIAIGVVKKV